MLFSDQSQLQRISKIIIAYCKLPFVGDNIPGAIMEATLATVRDAKVLNTYDFIDVLDRKNQLGWQVKSTKLGTPLTWKRAKIANSSELIPASMVDVSACQELGNMIIDFCNHHALESMNFYNLKEIGYSRLIILPNNRAMYFERKLCDINNPIIFNPNDYHWEWTTKKENVKKENLQSLKGIDLKTGEKIWAWHGMSENQLHFTGERKLWHNEDNVTKIMFDLPKLNEKISLDTFLELIENLAL